MRRVFVLLLLGVCASAAPANKGAAASTFGKGFPTADAAAKALVDATKSDNVNELIAILGPSSKDLISTRDQVEDRKVRRAFARRAAEGVKVVPVRGRPNEKTLLAGADNWPLPIPLVERNGMWYFDMGRGKKAILMRRVGSNELDAIEVCRGFVEAENQYAEQHRTAAGVAYYAQKIVSTPGQRDGLYWNGEGQDESPIGAIVARAIAEGYTTRGKPYHGYYFRVLTAQGPHAFAAPMNYIEDGVMTKGFALIAWPAQYGSTGIMTFVVNKSGIVYEKNLGRTTAKTAAAYTKYDTDATWTPVSSGAASLQAKRN